MNKKFIRNGTWKKGGAMLSALVLVAGLAVLGGCGDTAASKGSSSLPASSQMVESGAASSKAVVESKASSAVESKVASGVKEAAVSITLQVKHKDGTTKEFPISTKEANLRGALEQEGLVAGDESSYGLFVKTVDGETVNDADQEWWCLTKGGETWNHGVDDTALAEGDQFEFTFTVGY